MGPNYDVDFLIELTLMMTGMAIYDENWYGTDGWFWHSNLQSFLIYLSNSTKILVDYWIKPYHYLPFSNVWIMLLYWFSEGVSLYKYLIVKLESSNSLLESPWIWYCTPYTIIFIGAPTSLKVNLNNLDILLSLSIVWSNIYPKPVL